MSDTTYDRHSDLTSPDLTSPELTTDDLVAGERRPGQEPTTDDLVDPTATRQQQTDAVPSATSSSTGATENVALLSPDDRDAMWNRWRDIQAAFVDEPRQAIHDADGLVAGLMQQLAQMFAEERNQLEGQWSSGDELSTEELRVSLQRYRSFFQRLLAV